MRFSAVVLSSLLFCSLAYADDDQPKDIPGLKPFPGMHADESSSNDYNEIDFTVGDEDKTEKKGGHYYRALYQLNDGAKAASPVEIVKNYENAFKAKGGKLIYKSIDPSGGVATYSMPNGKGERWMQLNINNAGETADFQVIDTAEMKQKVEVSADEMASQLESSGRVALHGILFDTGKDTIKPESEATLNEIVTLLQNNATLKVSIEGHTDNQGDKKANQTLSQKRADAVKKWLVAHGVDGKRLSTAGFGDSKPVADNKTEDGRAQNRRVELVKK